MYYSIQFDLFLSQISIHREPLTPQRPKYYSLNQISHNLIFQLQLTFLYCRVPVLGINYYLCTQIEILMERIFAKRSLRQYWEKHSDSEQYLKTWYDTAMNSDWKTPNEVKQTYANASILKDNRIVFNIKGNSYRLVAKFNYEKQWIFIRFIVTHSEYERIDANTI